MIDVTILYFPDGSVSSSIAPLEVFYAAGTRWNLCVSTQPEPRFTVTTVSVDGKPVVGGAGVRVVPDKPLSAIQNTDLVLVPAGGKTRRRLVAQLDVRQPQLSAAFWPV